MDVLIRKRVIEGIPVLEVTRHPPGVPAPVAVLYHGYTAFKEMLLPHAYHLARAGFLVVLADAWGHGERGDGGTPPLLDSIFRTAAEVGGVLAAYPGRRACLAGWSMGGCITFAYLAGGGRGLVAAATVIASPDLVSVLQSPPGRASLGVELSSSLVEDLSARQPAACPERAAGVPLLVMNGAADELMPLGPIRAYVDALRRLAPATEVRHSVYPGVAHADNLPMNLEMLAWFRGHFDLEG